MQEALFYEKLANQRVRCKLCNQRCVINDGRVGICAVRKNISGKLMSLNYGKIIAANIDPIEKKPLFHFLSGTLSYSIATIGCNFKCAHCQNADISQVRDEERVMSNVEMTPEEVVELAIVNHCPSISYTYTEPTIFYEFALDCMKLAHWQGLKNIWVSNGYTAHDALELAKPYLDAANIDLKFFTEHSYQKICGAKLQPVLDNLKWYYQNKIWLEVTTLVIPKVNDSDKELSGIAKFISEQLGKDAPWHLSAFFPAYEMMDRPPTPKATIKRAYEIGKAAGLNFVYGGNIIDEKMENTYCPKCGAVVVERHGYEVERRDEVGKCKKCGNKIALKL